MQTVLTGELSGEWWLPNDPDRRLGGFLRLEPGQQPELRLAGRLSSVDLRLSSRVIEHPAVLGMTALGKAITLVRSVESGQTQLFGAGVGDTVLTAPRAYVGGHFRREADAMFRRMDLRLSNLDAWFPPSLIDMELIAPRGRLKRSTLTLEPARNVVVHVEPCVLTFGHGFATTGNRRTEAGFTQNASIVATTDRVQPLAWWLSRVVKPLRYLLAISTERQTNVESLRLRRWATKPSAEVEVVWANDAGPDDRVEVHQSEMLLWYGDLADRFEPALHGWFASVATLEPIFDQYFATLNTSRSYAETRFTMVVGAAEAYHRERVGGTDAPSVIHRQRLSQARRGVDRAHLRWLNERLNNRPTLQRRLLELCDLVPEVTEVIVGTDIDSFVRAVRDARNLRTHLDLRGGTQPESLRLISLAAKLGVVLEAAILHCELGFDRLDLAVRVQRSSRLRRVAIAAARD
jgi:hypothetical protein